MKTNIEVGYKKENKIYIKIGSKQKDIITDEKKEIKASEIYDLFNYKKGKEYQLKEKEEYVEISEEYKKYLDEIYEMIEKIVHNIS